MVSLVNFRVRNLNSARRSAPVFRSGGRAGGIGSLKRLRWRSFITGASWLHTSCTLSSAGLPAWACPVRTLWEASSPTFSLFISLSHSQLVLSRGIHPSLLPPIFFFFCCPSCSLYLSLCPLLPHPSLLLLLLLSQPPFLCHFHPVRMSRRDVAGWAWESVCECVFVCVYIEDGSELRCRRQAALGTSQAGSRTS